jgi:galactonate dehydratase
MRIVSVDTFAVPPRWLFVRVRTDEGLTGWGEATLEGRLGTVAAAVAEVSEHVVGADPLRIEAAWQLMTRAGFYRGGPVLGSAVAGIDQALWDIAGKAHGVPVHHLLGGAVRDRVRVYGWIGGDRPGDVAAEAARQVEAGFTAVKMNASAQMRPVDTPRAVAEVVQRATAVREVLGDDRDVAIDFHGRVGTAMARRLLPALEPVQPLFVEEPVLPEHTARLGRLAAGTTVPIATGERLYSRWDFRPALEAGIAVAQPDVAHAGGISEVRRIASLAEVYDVAMAPHCPIGPVALAACLQVDAVVPNLLIQEQSLGIHYNVTNDLLDYLADPAVFAYAGGYVAIPQGPGLGITLDEEAVRAAARAGHEWKNPVWRNRDGTLAEW